MFQRVVVLVSAVCSILIADGAVAKQPNGIAGNVTIVNDSSNAVPVTGDVNASVEGEVEVSGSVDVDSVPQSLTNQLQELIDAVEAIGSQGGASEPAKVTYFRGEINCSGTLGCPDSEFENFVTWPEGLLISSITIGSENDEMVVSLYDGASEKIARYGAENEAFRGPINHLTFPDPILAYQLTVLCRNRVEDCEFEITVVGRPYN